jgi:uncharacterized protein
MGRIDDIIKTLDLKTHPEGGYFRETYRSEGEILQSCLDNNFIGNRNYSTCIYFLLTSKAFSAFHMIRQDEIWHFYDGSALQLHMISPEGNYSYAVIGKEINNGQVPQFVVPASTWFAASVLEKESFALLGCTVAPGFDFSDFTLADRNYLIIAFPQHKEVITRLTRT